MDFIVFQTDCFTLSVFMVMYSTSH